jgi:hypothetical protein
MRYAVLLAVTSRGCKERLPASIESIDASEAARGVLASAKVRQMHANATAMHAGSVCLTGCLACSVRLGRAEVQLVQHPRIQQRYACVDVKEGHDWQLWECQQLGRLCVEAEVSTTLLASAVDGSLLPLLAACFAVSVQRRLLCEGLQSADDSCDLEARSGDAAETLPLAGSDNTLFAVQELFEISIAEREDQSSTASSESLANALHEGRELHLFMLAGQSNMAGRGRLDELPEDSCLGPDGFPRERALRDSIFFHSPVHGWLPA